MKKILTSILLISTFSLFSQSIKALYLHKFLSNKKDSIFSFEVNTFSYGYTYSNKKSIYKLIDAKIKKKDSLLNDKGYYDTYLFETVSINEKYKELIKKIFLQEYTLYDNNFSIKDNLQNLDWELYNDEQVIKGFKCKKAISTKEKSRITAWYCEDIPINDGPDRFYGLPGFILKVEIGEFSIIEIDQFKLLNENLKIEPPLNKSKYITMAEFVKQEIDLFNKKANED